MPNDLLILACILRYEVRFLVLQRPLGAITYPSSKGSTARRVNQAVSQDET